MGVLVEIPNAGSPIIVLNSSSREVELSYQGRVFGSAEEFIPLSEGRVRSGLALVTLWDTDVIHHHNVGEETYIFWRGDGEIFLNGEIVPFVMGTKVVIPPGALHAARPTNYKEIAFWCVSTPPFTPEDVVYDRKGQWW